ncbi:MAG: sulfotransferase family 2 domain-containing protein [Owenweeksia sp.]
MSGPVNLTLRNTPPKVSVPVQRLLVKIIGKWPFQNFMMAEMSHMLPYWGRVPVIDFNNKRILFYSPKAGCSTAIKWFLRGAGLLNEAMEHNPEWVHSYISEVYRARYDVNKQLPRVLTDPTYVRIKVVRNPFSRFASAYYHAIRYRKVFFPGGLNEDFNMVGFLELLQKQEKRLLNPHFAPQYSLWEEMYPGLMDEVLHLEDLDHEIEEMNKRHGWHNPLDREVTVLQHAAPRENMDEEDLHLRDYGQLLQRFPKDYSRFFTNEEFREMVYQFYRQDFDCYGYSKNTV